MNHFSSSCSLVRVRFYIYSAVWPANAFLFRYSMMKRRRRKKWRGRTEANFLWHYHRGHCDGRPAVLRGCHDGGGRRTAPFLIIFSRKIVHPIIREPTRSYSVGYYITNGLDPRRNTGCIKANSNFGILHRYGALKVAF